MLRKVICTVLILFSIAAVSMPVFGQVVLGDTNVEPVATGLNAQYVEALTKIAVNQSFVIHSVSMYLQYGQYGIDTAGSGESQCLKFGVYGDNGASYGLSSPIGEPLIAATQNGYCFAAGIFGPGWETWALQPSDYLTIPKAGVYWLAVLPEYSYGNIYHFTYTGLTPGQYLYSYGYFMYAFPASYALGFPPTPFGVNPYGYNNNFVLPFNSQNVGEYNAPYSFYVTGT